VGLHTDFGAHADNSMVVPRQMPNSWEALPLRIPISSRPPLPI